MGKLTTPVHAFVTFEQNVAVQRVLMNNNKVILFGEYS